MLVNASVGLAVDLDVGLDVGLAVGLDVGFAVGLDVPLASYDIQVSDELIVLTGVESVGSSLWTVLLWILGGILVVGLIMLVVYLLSRKQKSAIK